MKMGRARQMDEVKWALRHVTSTLHGEEAGAKVKRCIMRTPRMTEEKHSLSQNLLATVPDVFCVWPTLMIRTSRQQSSTRCRKILCILLFCR